MIQGKVSLNQIIHQHQKCIKVRMMMHLIGQIFNEHPQTDAYGKRSKNRELRTLRLMEILNIKYDFSIENDTL